MFVTDQWLGASIRRYGLWYLRGLIATLVLSAIVAPGPRATLETPQVVHTEKPLVCVHTRLIDEVWEWKIQHSLQLVREMGATTIVEFFPWAYIENTENQYDWASADRIVRHAQNQGLQVIARVGFVPAWARPDIEDQNSTLNYLPESSYTDFAEFVGDFAARYAGTVNRIIIWNEPNLAFEWGYQPIDPAGYIRLLQAVYPIAHAANPEIEIIAAPLAPTLEPIDSPNGLDDLIYMQQLYEAGLAEFADAIAIHTYGFTDPPETEPAPDMLNFRRAELLYEIINHFETQSKPVYITETGWNDHPRWAKAVRPAQRIAYTLDAYRLVEKAWPWVDKMCVWAFRFPAPTQSYPDNFTLVTPGFQRKPLYFALQAYARGWEKDVPLWLPPPASSF